MTETISGREDQEGEGVLGELGPLSIASAPSEEDSSEETAFAAEIASLEEPVPEKESVMEAVSGDIAEREPQKEVVDFIAHARRAAQSAADAQHSKPKSSVNMRWVAFGGAAVMVVLICAAMVMAAGAINGGAHSMMPGATAKPLPQVALNTANSGTTRRQPADKGVAHLIALADSGDARAETALAIAYLKGDGVAGDDEAARRWSQAAAQQGQPVAEYVLGTLYLEGNRNESEAARWFLAAASQGNIKAMHNLAIAYAEGQGVEKDPAEAVKWFLRAAEAGYRDSQFDLGVVYERGLGVPQSARAALKWYLIAAAHGDMPSSARAQTLKQQMDPAEVKQATADATSFAPQEAALSANQAPVL
jgi:localization factor PodJL